MFQGAYTNKDQVKGRVNDAAEKIKEITGKVTGNPAKQIMGAAEKVVGKTRASYGDTKEKLQRPVFLP
ncbi:MAG: CsbD family protein [Pusillimonas sp.]|nr:MAG: CsbD family protein [Pusillimonas sp.]